MFIKDLKILKYLFLQFKGSFFASYSYHVILDRARIHERGIRSSQKMCQEIHIQ